MSPLDVCAIELSSFQLMDMTRSPDVAVITNLSPNHLDWHRDMDEYTAAKRRLLDFRVKTTLPS
ncbi:Mur ligase family protein [Paenibacillus hamazuiensis]|uniref:Mur ligase family protein n=1 Tax=Paenibacillus hamazuiensis TaxID=2936508 RepID=UPI0023DED01C|nr:Mur ligase family protein [Paenibacillus hamazuiensis]